MNMMGPCLYRNTVGVIVGMDIPSEHLRWEYTFPR